MSLLGIHSFLSREIPLGFIAIMHFMCVCVYTAFVRKDYYQPTNYGLCVAQEFTTHRYAYNMLFK